MIQLRVLGPLGLTGPEGRDYLSVLSQPKRAALLAYLAISHPGDYCRRDILLGLFWPELDEVHARAALSTALSFLRKALGGDVILRRGQEEVGLDPHLIKTDAVAFEETVRSGELSVALEIYRGHLLEGVFLSGCPAFDQWLESERGRLRELAAVASWDHAHQQIAEGKPTLAERTAQQALFLRPTDESRARKFIASLASGGDRAAAISFYERFGQILRDELELEPSDETKAVVNQIRAGTADEPPGKTVGSGGVIAEVNPGLSVHRREEGVLPHGSGQPTLSSVQTGKTGPAFSKKKSRWSRWVLGAAGAALILIPSSRFFLDLATQEMPEPPVQFTILAEVGGNAPAETRFFMGSLLSFDIDASGFLLTLPQAQIEQGLAWARRPDTTTLSVPMARELAERGGIQTVFVANLDVMDSTYSLSARIISAGADSVILADRITVKGVDDLIQGSRDLINRLAEASAARLGPARQTLRRPFITHSWQAWQKLVLAVEANSEGRIREAIQLSHEALELDPEFASAWTSLSRQYANLSLGDSARFALEQALRFPDRMTETQLLSARALLSGNPVEELRAQERAYRETGVATNNLALAYVYVGMWEEALAIHELMEEQAPFGLRPLYYHNWALQLSNLGRTDEARVVIEGAKGTPWYPSLKARIEVRAGNWEAAISHATEITESPDYDLPFRLVGLWTLASAQAGMGRVTQAFRTISRWRAQAKQARAAGSLRDAHRSEILIRMVSGRTPEGWDLSDLDDDSTTQAIEIRGLWAAISGDSSRARAILESLPAPPTTSPGQPTPRRNSRVLLEALLARDGGRRTEAASLLRPIAGKREARLGRFNPLVHWTLAELEEHLGNLESAANLFSGIAAGENFGMVDFYGFGFVKPFAHRRAALLFAELGELDKAQEHWSLFLKDFSDPDPEFEWMMADGGPYLHET